MPLHLHQTEIIVMNVGSEKVLDITTYEIPYALGKMNAPGEDYIASEMLKMGDKILKNTLKTLLNQCLIEGKDGQQEISKADDIPKREMCVTVYGFCAY